MSGSSIGKLFTVTNFGESHGKAIGAVIDGCPPGMPLDEADLQKELDRRKPGTSRHVTQRKESDTAQILSGVYEGKTTGTPIAILIPNEDQKSKDYSDIAELFRPAHADYTYWKKYGIRDPRGGGRSSARLTAPTVAAGAVARKWLGLHFGVSFRCCVSRIGELKLDICDWDAVGDNPFFCADPSRIAELEAYLDQLRRAGDSVGAELHLQVSGVPAGWGEPVYGRLDAELAAAFMGLTAVKAVQIGDGVQTASMFGSQNADELTPEGFLSNHAGGILGGISSGQPIEVDIAIKPTPSIRQPKRSINQAGDAVTVVTKGRHDPCVGLRASPIIEALAAIVLMDQALRHHAQTAWY